MVYLDFLNTVLNTVMNIYRPKKAVAGASSVFIAGYTGCVSLTVSDCPLVGLHGGWGAQPVKII